MNRTTSKLLRKLAKKVNPSPNKAKKLYKRFKHYYKELNTEQKTAFKEEAREVLQG